MTRLVAPSAAALFRLLARRAGLPADRTYLTDVETREWSSLTLAGERHRIGLRLRGESAAAAATAMCDGLEDAELPLGDSLFVADIAVERRSQVAPDGSIDIVIEALTING